MSVIFTETFPGPTGDDWTVAEGADNNWATSVVVSGSVIDIVSGEGRLRYGGSGGRSRAIAPISAADQSVLLRFRFASAHGQQLAVWLRADGDWQTGDFRPNEGYGLDLVRDQSDGAVRRINADGTHTFLQFAGGTSHRHNSNQWLRFEVEGNVLRARWWDDGTSEPETWTINTSDPLALWSSGILQVSVRQATVATAAEVLVDDLALTDLAPAEDTFVYVGGDDYRVRKLAISDGSVAWNADLSTVGSTSGSARVIRVDPQGNVWVGDNNGDVYLLHPDTGAITLLLTHAASVRWHGLAVDDQRLYVARNEAGEVTAWADKFNPVSSDWVYTGLALPSRVGVHTATGNIVVTSGGAIHLLDSGGNPLETRSRSNIETMEVLPDGRVAIGRNGSPNIEVYEADLSALSWSRSDDDRTEGVAADIDNNVYTASRNGNVRKYGPSGGAPLLTAGPIGLEMRGVGVASSGHVIVTGHPGITRLLDPTDFSEAWDADSGSVRSYSADGDPGRAAWFPDAWAADTFTSGSNLVQATVLPLGNQFLKLDGPSEAGYAETPHSAQVHIPGDIDIRWFGAAESWDSPWNFDRQQLVQKGVFGERAYKLSLLSSSAVPRFRISPDGSAFTFADASEAFTHPDGEFLGIRVTWRQSDGRVQFFTSTDDGDTWDQLGTDQTISQPSINNEGDIWIGYDEWSAFSPFEGRVQRVEIRDGIDGTIVASPDFTTTGPWEPGDDSTTPARDDNQSNPWSLEGNAVIGADVVAQIHQGLPAITQSLEAELGISGSINQTLPAITQTTDVAMRVLVVMG